MVSHRHFGRCANFHYEAAAAYGYAKKHGLEFSVPNTTNDGKWNPLYLQHLFHPNYTGQEDILLNEIWNLEQHFNEYPFKEEWRNLNIVFNGYNQSYRYFDFCCEEMLNDFGYSYEFNEGYCGLHLRLGDYVQLPYLHPVITDHYIEAGINYILENSNVRKFVIFSDEINIAAQRINKKIYPQCEEIIYSSGNNELQDMVALGNCEHSICSNSSFSLFASEMNRNPNKIIVVPSESNWFGKDNAAKMTVKDMYRDSWVQIKYTPIYEL